MPGVWCSCAQPVHNQPTFSPFSCSQLPRTRIALHDLELVWLVYFYSVAFVVLISRIKKHRSYEIEDAGVWYSIARSNYVRVLYEVVCRLSYTGTSCRCCLVLPNPKMFRTRYQVSVTVPDMMCKVKYVLDCLILLRSFAGCSSRADQYPVW